MRNTTHCFAATANGINTLHRAAMQRMPSSDGKKNRVSEKGQSFPCGSQNISALPQGMEDKAATLLKDKHVPSIGKSLFRLRRLGEMISPDPPQQVIA
jgi:hypothetical protein